MLSEKAGFYGQGEKGQEEFLPAPPRNPSGSRCLVDAKVRFRSHWGLKAFLAAAAVLGRAEQTVLYHAGH